MFIKYGKLIFLAMIKALYILLKHNPHKLGASLQHLCACVWVGAVSEPCAHHTPIYFF